MKLVLLGIALCAFAGIHAASTKGKMNKPEKKFFKKLNKRINKHLKDEGFTDKEAKQMKRKWNNWKKKNHKHYKDLNEDATKFDFFIANEAKIKKALKRHFDMSVDGPFADMTNKEFREKVLMPNTKVVIVKDKKGNKRARRALKDEWQQNSGWPIEIPDWIKDCAGTLSCGLDDIEFSWDCADPYEFSDAEIEEATSQTIVDLRTNQNKWNKPLVTPVKDQGICGSCWSFSATGAMESLMLKEGTAPRSGGSNSADPNVWWGLSEQQLVDCTWDRRKLGPFINHDCHGGWPSNAFVYSTVTGGWMEEEDYPYDSGYTYQRNYGCMYDESMNAMATQVTGRCRQVTPENEDELAAAVYHHGAIAVVVDSSGTDWQLYRGGIVEPKGCSASNLNHAVLLVGYGEENGEKYWIVRNSWGEWWGEDGYIRLARNGGNICGIATMPHYPTYESYPPF